MLFGVAELEYLGHIVGCEGFHINPKNIQAMPQNLEYPLGIFGPHRILP